MSNLRQAAQQALAYIEEVDYGPYDKWPVIIALKQALDEPDQKPVAELRQDMKGGGYVHWLSDQVFDEGTTLYTAPIPRKPDDEEVEQLRAQNTELDAACAKLEALNAELVEALRMSRDALNQMWQSDKARPALVVAERALAKCEASK